MAKKTKQTATVEHVCANCAFKVERVNGKETKLYCSYESSQTKYKKCTEADSTCKNFAPTMEEAKSCANCSFFVEKDGERGNCLFFTGDEIHDKYDDWACTEFEHKNGAK